MSGRAATILAILRKDLLLFTRDRFYAFMTILGLVFYVAVFWLLPNTVDETVRVGIHHDDLGPFVGLAGAGQEGLELVEFESTAALEAAVRGDAEDGVPAGLDFPDGFVSAVRAGEPTTVRVYLGADVPEELRGALSSAVREIAFALAAEQLPVTAPAQEEIVLGPDRLGDQVSIRERMRPLLVFAALLIEMLALATLVASEIQARTVTAVLATPARPSDFLAAKAITGTLLAFGEAFVLLVATGSLADGPGLLITATLLGAVLVTGLGLVAGSTGRDFVGIVFWSMLFLIPLLIPAMATLFPGSPAAWIRALPSYGLVETIVGVTAHGEGWAESLPDLGMLAGWCLVAFALGVVVLRRRVARL